MSDEKAEPRADALTVRDEFAIAALPSLLPAHVNDEEATRAATDAYRLADAMLNQRTLPPTYVPPQPA